MNKYRSKKTIVNGITFDSKKEADRYKELLLLQKSGAISNLELQMAYELIPIQKTKNGVLRSVKYIVDFVYKKDRCFIYEDVKGYKTKEYIIKRKLMLYIHNIEILET